MKWTAGNARIAALLTLAAALALGGFWVASAGRPAGPGDESWVVVRVARSWYAEAAEVVRWKREFFRNWLGE